MGRAIRYVVVVAISVPLVLFAFVVGSYSWDSYQASRVMRADMDAVAVGDSLSDVESIVATADASAVNEPFGSYMLGRADMWSGTTVDESRWSVRGFWLKTGITCYLEFVVERGVVSEVDDVYCEDDGWFE